MVDFQRTLTAVDGGEFSSVIEQSADGQWHATGAVRVTRPDGDDEQSVGIEMFDSEVEAYSWLRQHALARGFRKYQVIIKLLDGVM
jgi:hypothetical protein